MNKAKLATATAESFNAECWELAKQADGKWKLLDLAKHLFAQWQSERHHNKKKTRMNVDLRAKNQRLTDRNRALREEHSRASTDGFITGQAEVKKLVQGQLKEQQDETNKWRSAAEKWYADYQHEYLYAEQQRAEVLRLRQLLATHLVPVPGNPGMAFISHQN